MSGGTFVHRFGAFEFDPVTGRLYHGNAIVALPESESAMLRTLIANAGKVVSQDALRRAAWANVAVTPDSVRKSMSRLRKRLSSAPSGLEYITTVTNRGYLFAQRLDQGQRDEQATPAGRMDLRAYEAFLRGRADLHTLKPGDIVNAQKAFAEAIAIESDYVAAHIGLGNVCALIFEASRADAGSDLDSLRRAIHHARFATELSSSSADAWSTLAFALGLQGDAAAAALAASRAIDPGDWLHRLRLAQVSWGDERTRAARAVLKTRPRLALAHWLNATVLIACGALEAALEELIEGCLAQDQQLLTTGSFPAVGLHRLRGLVLAALGRLDEAIEAFRRELSFVESGQVYARECAGNSWYALGAIYSRQRRRDEAEAAFREALNAAPGNSCALAAVRRPIPVPQTGDPRAVDTAIARAVVLARAGRHADAAVAYRHAVSTAPPGAGWILPVEPLINVSAHPDIWSDVLAVIRPRAM
jgi:DNA-binding winged helix-turn-helix (wHTH) protein/Flp pilus assembly protein TadD